MTGFFKDLFSGDFSAAWGDIVAAWDKLPSWFQETADKLASEEGTILSGLVNTSVNDLAALVTSGGLTTAAITAEAKKIYAALVAQNVSTFTLQDVFSVLNSALSPVVAANAMAATTTSAPATGA